MFKLLLVVLTLLSFIFTPISSNAALITNLSDAELAAKDYSQANDLLTGELENINYITRDGWDIAWASPVNAEFWYGLPTFSEFDSGDALKNTLYSPLLQKNWMFVEDSGLNLVDLISIRQILIHWLCWAIGVAATCLHRQVHNSQQMPKIRGLIFS